MKGTAILFFCVALAAAKPRENDVDEDNYVSADPKTVCAQEDSESTLVGSIKYCNRFYKCLNGSPVVYDCPIGLVYNSEKEYCDWPSNVNCGDKTIAEIKEGEIEDVTTWAPEHGHSDPSLAPEICAAENSEGVLVANEYCNLYYKCINSVPIIRPCAEGLLYHSEIERCDWPVNVECGDRTYAINA